MRNAKTIREYEESLHDEISDLKARLEDAEHRAEIAEYQAEIDRESSVASLKKLEQMGGELKDLRNAIEQAQRENADQEHCTCVPLLKAELKRLREACSHCGLAISHGWKCVAIDKTEEEE